MKCFLRGSRALYNLAVANLNGRLPFIRFSDPQAAALAMLLISSVDESLRLLNSRNMVSQAQ